MKNSNNGVIATRRDIYYQDVDLFKSQVIVDAVIALFCKSLQFTPMQLGAVAAQKGLLFGSIDCLSDGGELISSLEKAPHTPCLIPRLNNVSRIMSRKPISSIIIVEKEAVFTSLLQSKKYGSLDSNSIILTGKGYPDLLTKDFTRILISSNIEVPVICMVDLDPFGMAIMKNYRDHGKGLRGKNPAQRIKLSATSLLDFFRPSDGSSNCLDLNLRDFSIAKRLICDFQNGFDYDDEKDLRFLSECQRMLFFGKKAELDLADHSNIAF